MARYSSSRVVQAAIRTKLHQDEAIGRGNFEAALGVVWWPTWKTGGDFTSSTRPRKGNAKYAK